MSEQLFELQEKVAEIKAYLVANKMDMTGSEVAVEKAKIRAAEAEIQGILTKGADPCPGCGRQPIGMKKPAFFFVGCVSPTCSERRSRGDSVKLAVAAWNDEVYFERSEARASIVK